MADEDFFIALVLFKHPIAFKHPVAFKHPIAFKHPEAFKHPIAFKHPVACSIDAHCIGTAIEDQSCILGSMTCHLCQLSILCNIVHRHAWCISSDKIGYTNHSISHFS